MAPERSALQAVHLTQVCVTIVVVCGKTTQLVPRKISTTDKSINLCFNFNLHLASV